VTNLPKRITSFLCRGDRWLMMERLVNRNKETGEGRFSSKQEMIDRALELFQPELEAEYRKVLGLNPPSSD
jgi:hypothetical protein